MRAVGTRFFVVGLLTLFMFVPLFFAGAIIDERSGYSRDTARSIAQEWGGLRGTALDALMWGVGAGLFLLGARAVWAVTFASGLGA